MSVQEVKWGQAQRYFLDHGYEIVKRGGDAIIKATKGQPGILRPTVKVGHKFSDKTGDRLNGAHLQMFRRNFGVTRDDILNH